MKGAYVNCCQTTSYFVLFASATHENEMEKILLMGGLTNWGQLHPVNFGLSKLQGWVHLQVIFSPSLHDLAWDICSCKSWQLSLQNKVLEWLLTKPELSCHPCILTYAKGTGVSQRDLSSNFGSALYALLLLLLSRFSHVRLCATP